MTLAIRDKVCELEAVMLDMPQVTLEVDHHFAPGVYVRKMFIPAGVALTGKIHRFETMNMLVSGTLRVTTDNGVEELTGPMIFNSKPGTKKAGYAVTDVIFMNIHGTKLSNVADIEQKFIAPSIAALEDMT